MTLSIDAHQHFWTYNHEEYGWIDDSMSLIRRDFLPVDLRPLLENNGLEGSVLVQVRQTVEETRWMLQLARENPFILGVVGWVNLCSPDVRKDLELLAASPKLVGIRHIVQSERDDFLLRPDFLRGVALLDEFNLAYDILIYTKHLPLAAQFVESFPRQRFVLDHLGKPPVKRGEIEHWTRGIRRLASFPNVFAKLSGLVTEADWKNWQAHEIRPYLDVAFECFGPSRLMMGSDWPACLVAASYRQVINLAKDYLKACTPEEQEMVLGGNAARFWRLRI